MSAALDVASIVTTSVTPQGDPISITKPSGTVSGDLWLVVFATDGTGRTVTTPTGWSALTPVTATTDGLWFDVMYRSCDGSEGASQNFTYPTGSGAVSTISCRITGQNGVDTSSGASNSSSNSPPVTATATGITLAESNELLLYMASIDWTTTGVTTFTAPSGFTDGATSTANIFTNAYIAYKAGVGSGATGDVAGTGDKSASLGGWGAFLVGIKSSAASNRPVKMAGEWGGYAGDSGGFAG
jgi:hypothetical protein